MDTVAVLMSTYNGEKYLAEQLDSILRQQDVALTLFVRDDGSSDGTKTILDAYAQKYDNIRVTYADNVGVGNSFMELLYAVPDNYDFYAFADQDDIWLATKLTEAACKLNESGAALYGSNQECVDKDGNSLGLRYTENVDIHMDPISILSANMIAGCTMVLTNELYSKLVNARARPSSALLRNRIHDVWVAEIASICGGIYYDRRSFILYRQHENNVVGAFGESFFKALKKKIKKVFHKAERNGRSKLAKEVCACFPAESARFPLLQVCATGQKRQLLHHAKELRRYTGESKISFFIKVILGWF